jgi:hypothetical protein
MSDSNIFNALSVIVDIQSIPEMVDSLELSYRSDMKTRPKVRNTYKMSKIKVRTTYYRPYRLPAPRPSYNIPDAVELHHPSKATNHFKEFSLEDQRELIDLLSGDNRYRVCNCYSEYPADIMMVIGHVYQEHTYSRFLCRNLSRTSNIRIWFHAHYMGVCMMVSKHLLNCIVLEVMNYL